MGKMKEIGMDEQQRQLQVLTGYPYECETCLTFQNSPFEEHICTGCGQEITKLRCREHGGLCGQCEFLIGK